MICKHCGCEFAPSKYTPAQKFCGSSCRDKFRYTGDRKASAIRRSTEWSKANRERYNENAKRSYRKHRVKRIRVSTARAKGRPEASSAAMARYRKKHRGRVNAKNMARYARLVCAIPPWADRKKIRDIYESCPPGHHVDHIIPLKGKAVCGLHCQANLRIIPATDNIRKGNRLIAELMELALSPSKLDH